MRHYATYFDRNYLVQGCAMLDSIARHDANAVRWVLALDEETPRLLQALYGETVRVVPLAELLVADAPLAEARADRPRREFVFTLTPAWIRFLLKGRSEADVLAYIDADMFFFRDVQPAWSELERASVLVVPHRFPSWHDDAAEYGRFNVGWLLFRRDAAALHCVEHWRERCLESCAAAPDRGIYGDQKYLDAWPGLLGDALRTARHPGVNLAPWNWAGHRVTVERDGIAVDGSPLVLFHFAQFRRISDRWWNSGQLEYGVMPSRLRTAIYGPYAVALQESEAKVRSVLPGFTLQQTGWREALGPIHLALLRIFFGQFWRQGSHMLYALGMPSGAFGGKLMGAYRKRRIAGK